MAHTLMTLETLSTRAESGRIDSPPSHSGSPRLASPVGQSAFTLTNNQSSVSEGAVEIQFWIMPTMWVELGWVVGEGLTRVER